MRSFRQQDGSGLVLIIGIAAALAIMAASLVALTANVAFNTGRERTREKSFDIAEGALDYGMNTLAKTWPAGTPSPAPTFDSTAFRGLGESGNTYANLSEYPNPKPGMGLFASASFYDDDQPGGGYNPATSARTDANLNDLMWVVATGATGAKRSSIQAKVHRNPVNTSFPTGIALYVGGTLANNAPGQTKKGMVHIEDQGSAPSVLGYAKAFGGKTDSEIFDPGITPNVETPPLGLHSVPAIDKLFSPQLIEQIIGIAESLPGVSNVGTSYYDCTAANPNGPDIVPSGANLSGVVVIRVNNGSSVSLGNETINSIDNPGILLILGGNAVTFDMSGNGTFWGVLYTQGICDTAHGTPSVHGMLWSGSDLTMKGTPDVYYNDSVIRKLRNKWTLSVNVVPNTWREIRP